MKKKTPKLSIIILNYNAGDFLKKCVESVVDSYFEDLKKGGRYTIDSLIIVDNGSTDGSIELVKSSKLKVQSSNSKYKVRFIENKKNLGFAAGNNVGVKEALRGQPDYILFLNPDTVVFPGVFSTVVEFMEEHPKVGVATPRLELADGRIDEACHRGFPTPWRAFCHFSGLERIFPRSPLFSGYTLGHLLDKSSPHKIDACSGAFMMVKKVAGEKIGWWDEDYFWYGEDLDFCFKIKKAGWEIYFLPQVKIIHYRGVTSGIKKHTERLSKAGKRIRLKAALASTEAMRIFYQKHFSNRYPTIVRFLVFWAIKILEKYRVWKVKRKYG